MSEREISRQHELLNIAVGMANHPVFTAPEPNDLGMLFELRYYLLDFCMCLMEVEFTDSIEKGTEQMIERAHAVFARLSNYRSGQPLIQETFLALAQLQTNLKNEDVLGMLGRRSLKVIASKSKQDSGLVTELKMRIEAVTGQNKILRDRVQELENLKTQQAVRPHANKFEAIAQASGEQATKWGLAIVILGLVAIGCLAADTYYRTNGRITDYVNLLHETMPRVLFVSLVLFLAGWMTKIYGAARHNQIVNQRRAASVDSFSSFAEATSGGLRDQVVGQLTNAIFSDQTTGYVEEAKEKAKTSLAEVLHPELGKAVRDAVDKALESLQAKKG